MNIDWQSDQSKILLNPRLSQEQQKYAQQIVEHFSSLKHHIWLSTSGTVQAKWVALSKEAILASAEAVNKHLCSGAEDRWLNALPDFHVGGLGIWARAHLSGASVHDFKSSCPKWNPEKFCDYAIKNEATLTSLVPTQVYDLVVAQLPAPATLRAIVVGGAALNNKLYLSARALGWNLLPSYGMTECCSQIATAPLSSLNDRVFPHLEILPHAQVCTDAKGFLCIKSPALLTGYVSQSSLQLSDPKIDGWFTTEDIGCVIKNGLQLQGRGSSFVKIGGESVSLNRLIEILESIQLDLGLTIEVELVACPDERLGSVIHLLTTADTSYLKPLVERFNASVMPFEHIRQVHQVTKLKAKR